jgi:aspartyl-tRNA(Asn)/glutamyl-tRNA(Gln) amidotransferase subunit A
LNELCDSSFNHPRACPGDLPKVLKGGRVKPGHGEKKIMTSLTSLTIAAARDGLKRKSFSALELTDAYLAAIERARILNAYIVETPDKAREMAKVSDAKLARGEGGALEGIPLGIKDLFATKGVHTQAASHVLHSFKPPYESTVTGNLWRD